MGTESQVEINCMFYRKVLNYIRELSGHRKSCSVAMTFSLTKML